MNATFTRAATSTPNNIYSWTMGKLIDLMTATNYDGTLFTYCGNTYSFVSAERESGSGRCFNVVACKVFTNERVKFFVSLTS